MKLWQKVVLALALGVLCGYLLNINGPLHIDGKDYLRAYLLPFGNTFIDLIKMVVVPLIFFSLISGVTSMTDSGAFKRVGLKAVFSFLCTAAFAVIIGLIFGTVFAPGKGVNLGELLKDSDPSTAKITAAHDAFSLSTLLADIVPNNVISAMSTNEHILQVVVFAIFTAMTINILGEKAKIVREFCQSAAQVVFKMIETIMKLSPYGVFAIITALVSAQGLRILQDLAVLTMTVACALFAQYLLFGLMIIVFGRISPIPFYSKMLEAQSFAFSTSSSKATLPTAMRVVNERIGVSKSNSSFVLPLGASINMDGTAIYLGICSLFFAQAYGIQFSLQQYVLLILTATLGSIGAAGIPGGSIIMMGMVFTSVGLPLGGIAVILGIDRILDMLRTTVNITGDSVITLLVDKSEGTFDENVYYDSSL
jgi:Na+/H+-dicarboxylate symporter